MLDILDLLMSKIPFIEHSQIATSRLTGEALPEDLDERIAKADGLSPEDAVSLAHWLMRRGHNSIAIVDRAESSVVGWVK